MRLGAYRYSVALSFQEGTGPKKSKELRVSARQVEPLFSGGEDSDCGEGMGAGKGVTHFCWMGDP